ncbi:MAG TPA: copper resistance system multicopper oxidase [Vitreimonas sp.]|uniref:copper resistance system multicopper oxidase n=1 Tax=Vitreimonas sp. TaxID=3069702 RepID=UPI002D354D83|nr:copper resistance system multicopper oxidase [Vitreimonas sp.]HYD89473.1 copper resistance system multicopper oxidase [Vitreimonas sp.]
MFSRRRLLHGAGLAGAGLVAARAFPAWAQTHAHGLRSTLPTLSGEDIALTVARLHLNVEGRAGHAVGINGTVPGPLIRLREGQNVRLRVDNQLDEETSIHWHGLILPFQMDGVPGVSFPGIRAGQSFTYEFPVRQYGTYWYHSHSGLQEQEGHYGPIVIDPAGADPIAYDREHVIVLSDYSFLHPHTIFARLKQEPGHFNMQRETIVGALTGRDPPLSDQMEWAQMRMDPTDISDVTGSTYTFLINGHGPTDNWTGLFQPGERVRLRFVNAAAMTIFNVRIPGLPLTIVQADGQNVKPVAVDEFQISVAETYDVIVEPREDRAFTLVAEAVDRSGMGRATLAPRPGMSAEIPPLRARPRSTMRDMGMDMSSMTMAWPGTEGAANAGGMDHGDMSMRDGANAPQVRMGPGVQSIAPMPVDRLGDRGQGLEEVEHRVLVYTDLEALEANPDTRTPSRSLELHLTGNMERFMWSFDGERFSEVTEPIPFRRDERVRVTLVNDSMMAHPIHLHGHFFELLTGPDGKRPRKHTVNVLPGGKVTFDLTADAPGDWAFHCHLLYHMHAGMFRVVTVRPLDETRS